MKRKTQIYWLSQMGGWGLFVLGNIIIASIQNQPFSGIFLISFFIVVVGILETHLFRIMVHRFGWKNLNISHLIPLMLISSVIQSALFTVINTLLTGLLSGKTTLLLNVSEITFWLNMLNFSALFLLWEIIYFAVNTFENWKREEILNLELKASKTEIELNSLKSQMNPHFMFNSMNSIRALVDEDPEKAKSAITMLSGILRNNLTLGRFQTIPLRDEIDLVNKYLSLEKIRFEERLSIQLEIDPSTLQYEIPPFMLQTLVENGIKHGIANRMEGGRLILKTFLLGEKLHITILNSGQYLPEKLQEGIGLVNTKKRLHMIYNGKASIEIANDQNEVVVKIVIPINNFP